MQVIRILDWVIFLWTGPQPLVLRGKVLAVLHTKLIIIFLESREITGNLMSVFCIQDIPPNSTSSQRCLLVTLQDTCKEPEIGYSEYFLRESIRSYKTLQNWQAIKAEICISTCMLATPAAKPLPAFGSGAQKLLHQSLLVQHLGADMQDTFKGQLKLFYLFCRAQRALQPFEPSPQPLQESFCIALA